MRQGDTPIVSAPFFAAQQTSPRPDLCCSPRGLLKPRGQDGQAAACFRPDHADTFNACAATPDLSFFVNNYLMRSPIPFDLLFLELGQTRMPKTLPPSTAPLLRQKRHGQLRTHHDGLAITSARLSRVYVQSSRRTTRPPPRSTGRPLFGGRPPSPWPLLPHRRPCQRPGGQQYQPDERQMRPPSRSAGGRSSARLLVRTGGCCRRRRQKVRPATRRRGRDAAGRRAGLIWLVKS